MFSCQIHLILFSLAALILSSLSCFVGQVQKGFEFNYTLSRGKNREWSSSFSSQSCTINLHTNSDPTKKKKKNDCTVLEEDFFWESKNFGQFQCLFPVREYFTRPTNINQRQTFDNLALWFPCSLPIAKGDQGNYVFTLWKWRISQGKARKTCFFCSLLPKSSLLWFVKQDYFVISLARLDISCFKAIILKAKIL